MIYKVLGSREWEGERRGKVSRWEKGVLGRRERGKEGTKGNGKE